METAPWRALLSAFADGAVGGPAFERAFLDLWRLAGDAGDRVPYAIDLLFYEVDAYCADPLLFQDGDNTEDMLMDHARAALARLHAPWPDRGPETAEEKRDRALLDELKRLAAGLGVKTR